MYHRPIHAALVNHDTMQERFALLSDAQRNCLRLVAMSYSSKEIALETGLSPQTVDQYLSKAANILEVTNRREAARLYSEFENTFNKSEFKPEAVVEPKKPGEMTVRSENEGSTLGTFLPLKWLPPIGGERHDLDATAVVYRMVRVSLFTTGAAGAIIAVVTWLNRLTL